jgi:hypothetical protein
MTSSLEKRLWDIRDEVAKMAEKITDLEREVLRLRKPDIYADARINDTPITDFASSPKRSDP